MLADNDGTTAIEGRDIVVAGGFNDGAPGPKHFRAEETGLPFYAGESHRTGGWAAGDEIDGVLQALMIF